MNNNFNQIFNGGYWSSNIHICPPITSNYLQEDYSLYGDDDKKLGSNLSNTNKKDINNINSIITSIYNCFVNKFIAMNFFFINAYENPNICFLHLKSMPFINFFKITDNSISVVAEWHSKADTFRGWDSVPENHGPSSYPPFLSRTQFTFSNIKEIYIYEWGFKIITGGINLFGVLPYAMNPFVGEEVFKPNWSIPFKSCIVKEAMNPQIKWKYK